MKYEKFVILLILSILFLPLGTVSANNDQRADKLNLKQGYDLFLADVDVNGQQAWLILFLKGEPLGDIIINLNDPSFTIYDNGDLIGQAKLVEINSESISLENLIQYNHEGNEIYSQDIVYLEIPRIEENSGILKLNLGYYLQVTKIFESKQTPATFQLIRYGEIIDQQKHVLSSESLNLQDNGRTVVSVDEVEIFNGMHTDLVIFSNLIQYDEFNHIILEIEEVSLICS